MNDLTPSLLSEIAAKMLNTLPGGATAVPAADSTLAKDAVASHSPTVAERGDAYSGLRSFIDSQKYSAANIATPSVSDSAADLQKIRPPHNYSAWLDANYQEMDFLRRMLAGDPASRDGSRRFDVAAVRRDFPALDQLVHGRPLVWFDNAATTHKPQCVIDAVANFYAHDNSNIHRGAHTLAARATEAFEQARQKVQSYLGASSTEEIVFVRGTTEGINLVAQTYGRKFLQAGDEILLSALEHHANIVPWQMIAKEKGAVIRVIPVNDSGEIMLDAYQSLLGPRTRLVGLTHASNSLGTILPVAEMTQMAKRYHARVLIDGAQSVAHLPVDVEAIGCDFFVFSGHKIFAPMGIGVVYAKRELWDIMPPWHGGGNMIRNVTFEETTYSDAPARFEAGTPSVADAVGLAAALEYIERLGHSNILQYEQELLRYAAEKLSAIDGIRFVGTSKEKVGVLSFVLPDRTTEDIGHLLDEAGIAVRAGHHCAQPSLRRFGLDSTVRPSFSFYNTKSEIDRLFEVLRQVAGR
jgi:cysteine desulfurase/selenocysteine lyase